MSGINPRFRRLLTCYSPVRRSSTPKGLSARLACVKHAASVRPEPGSNSPLNDRNQHDPKTAPETSYPTTSHHHGQIRHGTLRPVDGGSTSLNALAFSTLLSSQETDAHRRVSSRFPVGATSLIYPRFSIRSNQRFRIYRSQFGFLYLP